MKYIKKKPILSISIVFIIIVSLIFIYTVSFPRASAALNGASSDAQSFSFRYQKNDAFGFGEKLEYKVGYKFITAGTGYFYILPNPVYRGDGRKCYDIRFQVSSLESLKWIYKVEDSYRTILDVGGIFPWEFEQHVREGKYKRDFTAKFDQQNNMAYANNKSYKVPAYVHDIVSAFFYVRTLDLRNMKKGQIIYLQNFFDDTTHSLGVKMMGKETIEVEAGTFRCVVIQPLVMEGGLFKSEGNIFIWVTDDDRKIPVKVATKIIIGYVGSELVHYSGIRGPIDAKIE
ncbi:MAG: DUF3108 domain-containing protein [FCB group bacterium]|jgi:hypothetical protein